jgi:atypical dual specificity phosphatase
MTPSYRPPERSAVASPRFIMVVHPRLWGGEHPCPGGDTHAHRARLAALLDAGVTTFIDLTEPEAENGVAPYARRLRGAHSRGMPIAYFSFPIIDTRPPRSSDQADAILDVIEVALANEETVYVHCRSGVGRTGTMLGLHLVRLGYTPTQALRLVQQAWKRDPRSPQWPQCPQTDRQRRFACNEPSFGVLQYAISRSRDAPVVASDVRDRDGIRHHGRTVDGCGEPTRQWCAP